MLAKNIVSVIFDYFGYIEQTQKRRTTKQLKGLRTGEMTTLML